VGDRARGVKASEMREEKMDARGGRPRSIARVVTVRRRWVMCVRLTFRFLGTRWMDGSRATTTTATTTTRD